ncbi:hypothetical protein BY78_20220 [Escherichia coli O157:H7 str. K4406]|nr:hypothetical protein BY78_20220 [Escherichia coli O157:H7 str. K4406]
MALICELDEQWSFVGSKARQHWLWYAYNTKTGGVLAYTFGPRADELLALLAPFTIGMLTSDKCNLRYLTENVPFAGTGGQSCMQDLYHSSG